MYIAYSSTSSSTTPAAAESEEDTKYMDSDAPRISSKLRHLQIMTSTININHKVVPESFNNLIKFEPAVETL
jgi:hypothetical protein